MAYTEIISLVRKAFRDVDLRHRGTEGRKGFQPKVQRDLFCSFIKFTPLFLKPYCYD